MFLVSMFLIAFGALAMEVYSAGFGLVVGLFSMMGGFSSSPSAAARCRG